MLVDRGRMIAHEETMYDFSRVDSSVLQLPAADKLKLIRLLAEDLESGADISPLVPHKVYQLTTPYGAYGAAGALLAAAKADKASSG